jgi:hypothetical protein
MKKMSARYAGVFFAMTGMTLVACSIDATGPEDASTQGEDALSACSTSVTTNTYVGAEAWGTIKIKNTGSSAMTSPTIAFKVPSGVKCDYDASGWKHTQSGSTCTYSRKSTLKIAAGASYTFNYSTNSTSTFSAASIKISDPSCSSGGSGGSSSTSSSSSSTTGSSTSSSTTSSTGSGNPPGLVWHKSSLTEFESYPDPGSEECVKYNGCAYVGEFAFVDGKKPESWVKAHNIAAVHSKDSNKYKLKTLRLQKNGQQIDVVVYDECADSDCSGCCTENAQPSGFLIDLEKYTAQRFGGADGQVDWACLDCD